MTPEMIQTRAPKLFRIQTEEDLDRIPFENGMAAVEIPAELLDKLDLKHAERGNSLRLEALERSIRSRGYQPLEPITARIGRKGRWIVINGGHRITAARHIRGEFWTNLFGQKVKNFYFILFTNAESWKKTDRPDGVKKKQINSDGYLDSQETWERSEQRNQEIEAESRPKRP